MDHESFSEETALITGVTGSREREDITVHIPDDQERRNNTDVTVGETEETLEALNDILEQMASLDIHIDIQNDRSARRNIPATVAAALRSMATAFSAMKNWTFLQVLIQAIPVVNTMFNIVSALTDIAPVLEKILSIFGNGREHGDVAGIVRSAINDALKRYDDERIRTKTEACIQSFQHTQRYLCGLQSTKRITEADIQALQPRGMAENKDEFICELKIRIEGLFRVYDCTADKDSNTAKKILAYIQLYCQLVVVKQVVLWHLVCIIQRASDQLDGTIAAIKNVITCHRNDAERLLAKLAHPNEKTTIVLAMFDPDEMPFLHKYMTDSTLYQDLDYLKNVPITMKTLRWPKYHAVRLLRGWLKCLRYVRGTEDSSMHDESHFLLEKVEDGNYFSIRLDHDRRPIYLHVDSDKDHWLVGIDRISGIERVPGAGSGLIRHILGIAGAPGKDCIFKIIRLPDGNHLISPRQWPRYFIAMSRRFHGCLHGVFNDQGQRSHWVFDK